MNILVVDDDRKFCSTLKKILDKKGHRVVPVDDPLRVLHTAQSEQFDVLLIDHRMSPMTGIDLLQSLRREGVKVPAIMMSAFASRDTFFEARGLGIVNYINKPFPIPALEEMLDNLSKKQKE